MLASTRVDSPVGPLTLIASDAGLRAVLWDNDTPARVHLYTIPPRRDTHPVLMTTSRQLAEYFAGDRREFTVALDVVGTEFQIGVWRALTSIPYGDTLTYGELATNLGNPEASRAVGAANGRNPTSIVVPCHRVVGANGALTGFAGGVEKKAWLLGHEQGVRTLL